MLCVLDLSDISAVDLSVVRKVFLAQAPRPANLLYVEAELYT